MDQYEYLKRQHYLATHMELTEENVIRVLEELLPYIEADGGSLQFVEIEEETNFVKVRLGGACETCAMSVMTLKQGIEKKLMMEIPDCYGVVQVL
jgi:Fe-S cluster biogenesis protein NfuA